MNPAILPGVLLGWTVLSTWAAHRMGDLFTAICCRPLFKLAIFLALAPLPLMDELLARPQFEALCRQLAVVTLHDPHPEGRTVVLAPAVSQPLADTVIPVTLHQRQWLDARTLAPVVGWGALEASAGKLARSLESAHARPLTFEGRCAAPDAMALAASLSLHPVGGPLARP